MKVMLGLAGVVAVACCPSGIANPPMAAAAEEASLVCVAGGDLPNTNNVLWVVHKRKPCDREKKLIQSFDKLWSNEQEWITLSAYKIANGVVTRVYGRTITYDEMVIGLGNARQEVEQARDEVRRWEKKIEEKETPRPEK